MVRALNAAEEALASDFFDLAIARFRQVGRDVIDRMAEADLDDSTIAAVMNAACAEMLGECLGRGIPKRLHTEVIKRVREVAAIYVNMENRA